MASAVNSLGEGLSGLLDIFRRLALRLRVAPFSRGRSVSDLCRPVPYERLHTCHFVGIATSGEKAHRATNAGEAINPDV